MPRGTIQKHIDAERKEIKKETQDFDYDIMKISFDVENMLIELDNGLAEGTHTFHTLSDITHIKLYYIPSAIKGIDNFVKNSEKYLEENFITQANLNALKTQNNKLREYKIPKLKISPTNRKDITNHKEVISHMHKNLKPILERIEEIYKNPARVPKRSRSISKSRSKSPKSRSKSKSRKSKSKSKSRSNKRRKTVRIAIGGKKHNKTKKRRR
jgi:hypothetical protein